MVPLARHLHGGLFGMLASAGGLHALGGAVSPRGPYVADVRPAVAVSEPLATLAEAAVFGAPLSSASRGAAQDL